MAYPACSRKLTDVADVLVDRLGPDAEQGGDGHLRQGEALVQDDGQEPVGQGEDGGRCPGRLGGAAAAALVQAGFPLLVMQGQFGA